MKTTTAIVFLTSAVSSALATPLAIRAQMCNKAPTASTSTTSVQPIASPTAATAEACQQQCEANSACQSFVFGLPADASTPECMLFNVAASQVPSQGSDLNVFDKACASTSVPTQAPTHDNPIGTTTSTTGGSTTGNGNGNTNGNANGNTNGNANGNTGNNGNAANGNANGKRADICGAKPTGPTSSAPSPIQTATNVNSQQACLTLCQQTSGCQSCEFGKASANGQEECLLFNVAASELPAPTNGQTFVAFDTKC